MAQKQIIVTSDDIDGSIIDEADIRTLRVDLAGNVFTFDLRDETLDQVRSKLGELGLDVGKAPTRPALVFQQVESHTTLVETEPTESKPASAQSGKTPPAVAKIQPPSPKAVSAPVTTKSAEVRPPLTRIEVPPQGRTAKKIEELQQARIKKSAQSPDSSDPLAEAPMLKSHPPMPTTITAPEHKIEPGVNVVTAKREPRVPTLVTTEVDPMLKASFDWSKMEDEETTFHKLREIMKNGLPAAIPISYHPEVLATDGMSTEIAESALRAPDDVRVAPDSYEKKYAVLQYCKGDAMTVVGFRNIREPRIIAVYHRGLRQPDQHRVVHTGGGGTRKTAGLPTSLKQSINILRSEGAAIEWTDATTETAVTVMYKDQDLGKIPVGMQKKDDIQSNYQRMLRKIEAINNRK